MPDDGSRLIPEPPGVYRGADAPTMVEPHGVSDAAVGPGVDTKTIRDDAAEAVAVADGGADMAKSDAAAATATDPPFSSPALPVLKIDVKGKTIGPDVKVMGTLTIITDHDGTHSNLADRPVAFTSAVGVSLHGSSSLGWPQKSFSLELRDAAGTQKEAAILGFPSDADWVALACWADKTCMRNAVAYTVNRSLPGARWNPRGRWVEVFLDGTYNGLYWFSEAVRRGKNRIDEPKVAPTAAAGDVTGGYVISREEGGQHNPFTQKPPTDFALPGKGPDGFQMVYTYRYPKPNDITTEQRDYLANFYAKFNAMMASSDWNNPGTGYRKWMDVPSAVDYALVHEFTADVDSYWKSMYYTKDPDSAGGKIVVSPLWDFNLSFGNSLNRNSWKSDGLVSKRDGGWCYSWLPGYQANCNCDSDPKCWNSPFISFYWHKIWSDPQFQADLKCRYRVLRQGAMRLEILDPLITLWKSDLAKFAIPRHFARWPALKKFVDPNPCAKEVPNPCGNPDDPIGKFYDYEVKWMRDWIDRRLIWLDQNLPGTCDKP